MYAINLVVNTALNYVTAIVGGLLGFLGGPFF